MKRKQLFSFVLAVSALECWLPSVAFSQGYSGPSMLSRGGNTPGRRGRTPVDFTFYAALRGTVDTGLTPVALNPETGEVQEDKALYGVQAELGLYGSHAWKRSSLGVDYRGDYRRTTDVPGLQSNAYNGSNQALSLDYQMEIDNRKSVFIRESAGTTNRAFGGFSAPALPNANTIGVPIDEVFDARIYFSQTTAGGSYRSSARTTYSGIANAFLVKRTNRSLVGMTGYAFAAVADHRLTRRNTVSATYSYMTFDYPRAFGGAYMNMFAGRFARQVTRNFDVQFMFGGIRADVFGTETVNLSPEVAAILGRTQGIEAFRRVIWIRQAEAAIAYTRERSRFNVNYTAGATPGNGVYLTSRQEAVSAGYSFTGLRKLSIGASAAYSKMESLGATLGDLKLFRAGGGVNYRLGQGIDLSCQFDRRSFNSPGLRGRDGYSLALGLSYSPSRFPLAIW